MFLLAWHIKLCRNHMKAVRSVQPAAILAPVIGWPGEVTARVHWLPQNVEAMNLVGRYQFARHTHPCRSPKILVLRYTSPNRSQPIEYL